MWSNYNFQNAPSRKNRMQCKTLYYRWLLYAWLAFSHVFWWKYVYSATSFTTTIIMTVKRIADIWQEISTVKKANILINMTIWCIRIKYEDRHQSALICLPDIKPCSKNRLMVNGSKMGNQPSILPIIWLLTFISSLHFYMSDSSHSEAFRVIHLSNTSVKENLFCSGVLLP